MDALGTMNILASVTGLCFKIYTTVSPHVTKSSNYFWFPRNRNLRFKDQVREENSGIHAVDLFVILYGLV